MKSTAANTRKGTQINQYKNNDLDSPKSLKYMKSL